MQVMLFEPADTCGKVVRGQAGLLRSGQFTGAQAQAGRRGGSGFSQSFWGPQCGGDLFGVLPSVLAAETGGFPASGLVAGVGVAFRVGQGFGQEGLVAVELFLLGGRVRARRHRASAKRGFWGVHLLQDQEAGPVDEQWQALGAQGCIPSRSTGHAP